MANPKERTIILGARGSKLAQIQALAVAQKLKEVWPDHQFIIRSIRTGGDADQTSSLKDLGGTGVFVKELEAALQRREIDLASHSAKDLPAVLNDNFVLASVPVRDQVEDVLISREGRALRDLVPASRIATGSSRRRALVRSLRPDLELVDVRGNVDTRLRKLHEGQFDALILARAGLMRLGLENEITEILAPEVFVPAAGQAALAIECRACDSMIVEIAQKIDSPVHHACLNAERRLLAVLEAGCSIPLGAWARWEAGRMTMDAVILDSAGGTALRASAGVNRLEDAAKLGENLARELVDQGAAELLGREI